MKVTTDGCLFGAWCARELSRMDLADKTNYIPQVLDIGTGTGLLSLMVAQKNPLHIDAVEIDEAAAAQAASNIATSPFSTQIRVTETDILQLSGASYDAILSNPPFYEKELKSGNAVKDTAHHGHQLSWAELFKAINRVLHERGVFFLLLPYKRAGELEGYLKREHLFLNKLVRVKQSTRHSPFRMMVQGSREASALVEEELSIKDEHQQYTPEFVALLRDYYLYL